MTEKPVFTLTVSLQWLSQCKRIFGGDRSFAIREMNWFSKPL